jgi:glutamate/tyrosine decarboxylase-like PLP-dependent enzyme
MGLGLNNVVVVSTNGRGQMNPDALLAAIQSVKKSGRIPLAVNATAGTTVLGAFDPILPISAICKAEGVWLHLDAAWGGSFIFSPKLRSLHLAGVEECDSISWNAHKMLGAPLQCSIWITRHENVLAPSNSASASYLFQKDKGLYDGGEWDRGGDKS